MLAAWTITKREFGADFKSPIGYIVLGLFLLLGHLFMFLDFFGTRRATMEPFFGIMPIRWLFFGPAVAMGLLAEERGTGTVELLLTMPVRDWEVVIGKFLGALGTIVVGFLFTLPI